MVWWLLAAIILTAAPLPAAEKDELAEERSVFRKVYPQAERGDWSAVAPYLSVLRDYPLFPDLRAAYLRSQLDDPPDREIGEFLEMHPDLAASRSLRYRWAESLAERKRWQTFLEVYEAHYSEADDSALDCLALRARINLGRSEVIKAEALELWLVGTNQPKECEPVFDYLAGAGYLTAKRYRQRFDLAIEARELGLARFLAGKLTPADRERLALWEAMQAQPGIEIEQGRDRYRNTSEDREILAYGFERLVRRDPLLAHRVWPQLESSYDFKRDFVERMPAAIALSAAREHRPEGRLWLGSLEPRLRDDSTEEWRARLAIRDSDWQEVLIALNNLSDAQAKREIWRYWEARALEATGQEHLAKQYYMALAEERDYYGFLASDRLGLPYDFKHQPAAPDELLIAQLAAQHKLIRARELFLVGLQSRGRSEWEQALEWLTPQEKTQAAIMAHRWGWHSRAIATAARADLIDDLEIRYPIPYWRAFDSRSRQNRIPASWALGIARSESLFMADVRSRAGAVGLMQLMPATGRSTAEQAKIRYRGLSTLLVPETNIALGTHYLGAMLGRFVDNRVLATAAYNAGPHRVKGWLPKRGRIEADRWVDSIPFRETRHYVRRVLASEAVFYWRLTGGTQRLSSLMHPVHSKADRTLVARH